MLKSSPTPLVALLALSAAVALVFVSLGTLFVIYGLLPLGVNFPKPPPPLAWSPSGDTTLPTSKASDPKAPLSTTQTLADTARDAMYDLSRERQ